MGTQDILDAALASLSATTIGTNAPPVGQAVVAGLTPSLDDLEIIEALTGDLDLVWVGKDVLFDTSDLEPSFDPVDLDAATTGSQPAVTTGGTLVTLPDTPGLLGQLKGSIPVGLGVQVPVTVTVTWRVLDAAGNLLSTAEYQAPDGLSSPEITVLFAPEIQELLVGAPPGPVTRQLEATVTLSAGGFTAGPTTLPPVPVLVPTLLFPTVLAAFIHTNFQPRYNNDDGGVLVVVRTDSPLSSAAQLQSTLNTLQAALSGLSSFAQFAAMLVGVSELVSALAAQISANVQFRSTMAISNLHAIKIVDRPWYQLDTNAGDDISSLILLGPPAREVDFFKGRNFNNTDYRLTPGADFFAIVRTLHANNPVVEGGTGSNPGEDLGDKLSSLRWV